VEVKDDPSKLPVDTDITIIKTTEPAATALSFACDEAISLTATVKPPVGATVGSAYEWYMDGELAQGSANKTEITLKKAGLLAVKTHTLTVVVKVGASTNDYSRSVTFTVIGHLWKL
jgi:hypothetical protein